MVAPSGEQYVIGAGDYRAVVTECGAGLRLLEYDGRPLVAGFPEEQQASSGRGQLLLPWPNRIADGRYRFAGREHQLPLTEVARGHASHGLTRWASWRPVQQSASAVALGYRLMAQPGYPWTLDLAVRYELAEDGLAVTVTAANRSAEAAPFAAGAHPYVTVGTGPVDDWMLTLRAGTVLEVDERLVPTGRAPVGGSGLDFASSRRIGTAHLDNAFTDLERDGAGRAEVRVEGGAGAVTVWMDRHHPWVQLFTGPPGAREALAVEPMSAPPNAFVSGEDVVVLAPAGLTGDTFSLAWGIRAG